MLKTRMMLLKNITNSHTRHYLTDVLKLSLDQDCDLNYRKAGLIDSLELVRFIIKLEKEFNIKFTDAQIESEEFSTITGLADIINNLRHLS